jgi:hypothetical protein
MRGSVAGGISALVGALIVVGTVVTTLTCSASTFDQASSKKVAGTSQPVACLSPRAPSTAHVTSWLPQHGGAIDYEPENAGVMRKSSPLALRLAQSVQVATGHGFRISTVREFHSLSCVVDWDFVMSRPGGGVAFVRVLQLRSPLNEMSFPLVGTQQPRERLANGTEVVRSLEPNRSSVTVISVRRDGLLIFLQVRSPSGPDPTGWPTTTISTIPVSGIPAALTISQATAAALSISNRVATS